MQTQKRIFLLDYGAGNVRSVVNAVTKLGFNLEFIKSASDFDLADSIIFPGVGSFGRAIDRLHQLGFYEPLKEYLRADRPFMGICVGMQCLYNSSTESPGVIGLGLIDSTVSKFDNTQKSVPQIGWNSATPILDSALISKSTTYYFVHSYAVIVDDGTESHYQDWCHTLTTYKDQTFVSSVARGNLFATQFHPEKSGPNGLLLLEMFLNSTPIIPIPRLGPASGLLLDFDAPKAFLKPRDALCRRIIACLDVRSNDKGDLVVTKGDQYDVREKSGDVRNLGKPIELAQRYYREGADEITFLNITSFRDSPLKDTPMLEVLRKTSENVFVPLTIGGGIRETIEPDGTVISAIDVAGEYFRSGADKVSIGSDAVYIAERYWQGFREVNTISVISNVYGAQAVVISVDPKRVYVRSRSDTTHETIETKKVGLSGEIYCWYQCTVKGGRETRDLDVVQLVTACEALGAGEILLNCMDNDGMKAGYDHELINMVKASTRIPVIASSGAGNVEHFEQVFRATSVDAALAAGIFHRNEVTIGQVKEFLDSKGFPIRI